MHVVFLAPNFPIEQRAFVRALFRAGAQVTGIGDVAPEQIDAELWRSLAGYHPIASLDDEAGLSELVARIGAERPIHHLICTVEPYQLIAARLRDQLDLAGPSAAQVARCHNRDTLKQLVRGLGLGAARCGTLETADQLRRFVAEVGLPVLVGEGGLRADSGGQVEELIRRLALPDKPGRRQVVVEELYLGHEGFFDTLTVNGRVVFEAISHCYPNPLEAMRTRELNPYIVCTNRVDAESYAELRRFGRSVLEAVGADTGAQHLGWCFGDRGLWLSELRLRPPGARFWELHGLANEVDLYDAWAQALVRGRVDLRPTRRFAAGLLAIRPDRDGRVLGYRGVDEVRRRYGEFIVHLHLPAIGQHTAELGAGYTAHGWMWARHPDYDELRRLLERAGELLQITAG